MTMNFDFSQPQCQQIFIKTTISVCVLAVKKSDQHKQRMKSIKLSMKIMLIFSVLFFHQSIWHILDCVEVILDKIRCKDIPKSIIDYSNQRFRHLLLLFACERGNLNIVQMLIEIGHAENFRLDAFFNRLWTRRWPTHELFRPSLWSSKEWALRSIGYH